MANTNFLYLGFGLLANRDFVQTLFGRDLRPTETQMELKGFELRVLDHGELPQAIQEDKDTPPNFRMYGLAFGEPDSQVRVLRLEVSPQEHAAIQGLNYGDALFTAGLHFFPDGNLAIVDHLSNESSTLGTPVEGIKYNPFLNDRSTAFAVARRLRGQYLRPAEQKEGLIGKLSTIRERR